MAQVTGGERLAEALRKMRDKIRSGSEVRVGFLENATYPDGTKVATVAAINNFGAPEAGVPARPFFSEMVARNSPDWGDRFAEVLVDEDYDAEAALGLMGDDIAWQLRQSILEFSGVPLSPVTLLLRARFPTREGMTFADVMQARHDVATGDHLKKDGTLKKKDQTQATNPLVWSGSMLNGVDREVK